MNHDSFSNPGSNFVKKRTILDSNGKSGGPLENNQNITNDSFIKLGPSKPSKPLNDS
jgi:hypothetical protein